METTNTTIDQLGEFVDQIVTLTGWVHKARASGKIAFIVVRDGTGLCQCVVEKSEQTEPFFDSVKRLPQESSLTVTGTVSKEERSVGGYELKVTDVAIVHAASDYPITPKPHGVEFLMKHRHLWFHYSTICKLLTELFHHLLNEFSVELVVAVFVE